MSIDLTHPEDRPRSVVYIPETLIVPAGYDDDGGKEVSLILCKYSDLLVCPRYDCGRDHGL